MTNNVLTVPKIQKQVALWIHPEGKVIGELYLRQQSTSHAGEEQPSEALEDAESFVVVHVRQTEEVRFYNLSSIIRVEYREHEAAPNPEPRELPCQLHLMDGSMVIGKVREALHPERARLLDYLNEKQRRFVKVYVDDAEVCLVNKAYVIRVTV